MNVPTPEASDGFTCRIEMTYFFMAVIDYTTVQQKRMMKQGCVKFAPLWCLMTMCGHGSGDLFGVQDIDKAVSGVLKDVGLVPAFPQPPPIVPYLGLPIEWTVPLGRNGEYDFTGRVYLRKFEGKLAVKSMPPLNVSIVKTTTEGELTYALVRVRAFPWHAELQSFIVTATRFGEDKGITTEVKVHLINATRTLPRFPESSYTASYRKGQEEVITMKAFPENIPVVYTLDSNPYKSLLIEKWTGFVSVYPDDMTPGVYIVLVYAETFDPPTLLDYTALRVTIVEENTPEQSTDTSAQSSETDVGFGIPRPRTGCPNIDFTEGNIPVSGGTLNLTNTFISYGPNHIDVCRYSERMFDVWPEGNYCVFEHPGYDCPAEMSSSIVDFRSNQQLLWREHRCCRRSTDDVSQITWPQWRGNFYLLPTSTDKCQKIVSYEETLEAGRFSTNDGPLEIATTDGNATWSFVQRDGAINFCAYRYIYEEGKNYEDVGNSETDRILIYTFGTIGAVILLVASLCIFRRRRKRKQDASNRIKTFKVATISTHVKSKGKKSELQIGSILKMILDLESQMTIYGLLVHPDRLQTMWMVGKGAFGKVYQAIYRPDDNQRNAQEVAVKTLKENCVYPEISAFMEEAIVMADFRHVNVLSIIGVCIDPKTEVPSLVMPFMRHGDLQKYLRGFRYDDKHKSQTPELPQLLSFCQHIARGMAYLANMKFVHRDLAARNCMLSGDLVVKVADFGLTRDIYSNSYYRQDKNKLLPIKWMALESLQDRVFTLETDVWSYGITVWEIFTLGKVPYPNLENFRVLPELEKGERLPKPDTCPDVVYDLILRCWTANPKDRPSFTDICEALEAALTGVCDYLDLESTNAIDLTAGVNSPSESAKAETQNDPSQRYDDYRDPSFGHSVSDVAEDLCRDREDF